MACLHHHSEAALLGLDTATRTFREPGVEPHYGPSRSVAIEHVALRLDLYPEERRFAGEGTYRMRPQPGYAGRIALDLDEVVVDAVTDAAGAALPWTHDANVLEIRADAVPEVVVVRWHGQDPRLGLYFTGPTAWAPDRQAMAWTQCQDEDAHYVLPCHDHPRAKHPWRIELTGPAGTTLLSNGKRLDGGERDGRAFAVWEQAEPMPAYLLTAVCARLSVVEATGGPVPVRYLVPVGQEEAVERAMGRTPAMIAHFAEITGTPYPWPRYDQVVVHDFVFGGMENVACTTMTDVLLVDEKGVADWDPDGLVAHELAHQWFGDLVTCQDWSQGWLNESWATFMESVWWEASRPAAAATWYRYALAREYFDEDGDRYRRPIVSYDFREPIDVFDRHLYQKGGCVLATLRSVLGDAAFWAGVKLYLGRHAHQTVHTRHFQRALEDASGANLDRFFAEWVHGAGHPDVEVALSASDGLLTVAVKQTQSGEQTASAFAFPLRVEIVYATGSRVVDLPVRERERAFVVPLDGDVRTVRVDPGFRVLAHMKWTAPRGWLVALLSDACPVVASRAAAALLEDGATAAVDAVCGALSSHPSPDCRGDLAAQLGKRGGARARDALVAALVAEADPRVRRAVAQALGKFRDPVVADALVGALSFPHATWQLEGALLVALGATRDPRAVDVIRGHLGVESWSDQVRRDALAGLAATEDPAALADLLAYSALSWPQRVRAAAAMALGKLGDKVESVRPRACERLCEMLDEPGFRSQVGAVTGLATLRHPASSAALTRAHASAADGRVRRLAFEALEKVRAGRTAEQGLASLRREIEKVASDHAKLREALHKLDGGR